jgi:transcriptional regulator with XRE-family HTH domain
MDQNDWNSRLKAALKAKGWTKSKLAYESGVSIDNVHKYITGRVAQPRGDAMQRLAEALSIDPVWLLAGVGPDPFESSHSRELKIGNPMTAPEGLIREINPMAQQYIEMAQASLDEWRESVTRIENTGDYWRAPVWVIARMNCPPEHIRAVPVMSDFMEPSIDVNDVVFVDDRVRFPTPPGIYAIFDPDTGIQMCRLQVVRDEQSGERRFKVSFDNPLRLNDGHLVRPDDIEIIGRYIGRFTSSVATAPSG